MVVRKVLVWGSRILECVLLLLEQIYQGVLRSNKTDKQATERHSLQVKHGDRSVYRVFSYVRSSHTTVAVSPFNKSASSIMSLMTWW